MLDCSLRSIRGVVALGVDCEHCHSRAKLPPGVTPPPGALILDFALDDKPTKQTARQMILMVRTINTMVPVAVGKPPDKAVHIQCMNCHRGTITPPLPLGDVLDQTSAKDGREAAMAQFRQLRKSYYGSQLYDFSDGELPFTLTDATHRLGGLQAYAQQLIAAGRTDDAIAWLKLNLEFYPKSAESWAMICLAYEIRNDRASAVGAAEKAVALAPGNPAMQATLAQAKAIPALAPPQAPPK
jgi:Photosynthetic reaction centre cytochrome C subunit